MAARNSSSQKCQAKGEIGCNPKPKSCGLLKLRMFNGVAEAEESTEVGRSGERGENMPKICINFLIKIKHKGIFKRLMHKSSKLVEKTLENWATYSEQSTLRKAHAHRCCVSVI